MLRPVGSRLGPVSSSGVRDLADRAAEPTADPCRVVRDVDVARGGSDQMVRASHLAIASEVARPGSFADTFLGLGVVHYPRSHRAPSAVPEERNEQDRRTGVLELHHVLAPPPAAPELREAELFEMALLDHGAVIGPERGPRDDERLVLPAPPSTGDAAPRTRRDEPSRPATTASRTPTTSTPAWTTTPEVTRPGRPGWRSGRTASPSRCSDPGRWRPTYRGVRRFGERASRPPGRSIR